MSRSFLKPIALACLALGTVQAHADSVDFLGFANGSKTVNYKLTAPNVAKNGSAAAGGFTTVLNGGPSFTSYCVDLYESISFADPAYNNYNEVDGSAHFTGLHAAADADIGKLFSAGHLVNNAKTQAAFQIAIWEIAYETSGSYNLSTGTAKFSGGTAASSGALTLATSWLGSLGANTMDVKVLESLSIRNIKGHQDVVFAQAVPEPSTYALMAAGLMSIGFVARRRSQKQR